jgi:hypothetical protein
MDLEQLEALALSDDRSAALAELLPGTVEHDYWRGILHQHRGELDVVDTILREWPRRHGRTDELHARLKRRQLLLRAGADLKRHADALRFAAGAQLEDQAESVAAAYRSPTRLDPAVLDEAALVQDALGRTSDLSYVTDWALAGLVAGKLDTNHRRSLLQRLTRANIPGTVPLIAAELAEKSSRGFGGLAIHNLLTLDQLEELATLRPELRKTPAWVTAVLARLRPAAHVDWQHDPAARAAYLAALWAFARQLPPAFNALKVQVLYHQLDLDRRGGDLDRARFLEYIALPRRVAYARSERLKDVPNEHLVTPGTDAAQGTGLDAVHDDEPLVREYLGQLLLTEDGEAFTEWLRADWLAELLAVTRLLAGANGADRWAAQLGPTALAALRERVDLDLTVRNPARVAADAAVTIEVDVKNVPQLVVKTFRIDPVAYYLARRAEVDTTVDLDGMVASDEQLIRSDVPAIRRVRQRIPLPGCARPGTYVIELIGNGKSSRALIRKGGLRHTVRVGVAGLTVRVLDDDNQPVPDARLWLGDREYTPRDDGAISIPFSTSPTRASVLLVHGEVAQLEPLHHPAEHYQLLRRHPPRARVADPRQDRARPAAPEPHPRRLARDRRPDRGPARRHHRHRPQRHHRHEDHARGPARRRRDPRRAARPRGRRRRSRSPCAAGSASSRPSRTSSSSTPPTRPLGQIHRTFHTEALHLAATDRTATSSTCSARPASRAAAG